MTSISFSGEVGDVMAGILGAQGVKIEQGTALPILRIYACGRFESAGSARLLLRDLSHHRGFGGALQFK